MGSSDAAIQARARSTFSSPSHSFPRLMSKGRYTDDLNDDGNGIRGGWREDLRRMIGSLKTEGGREWCSGMIFNDVEEGNGEVGQSGGKCEGRNWECLHFVRATPPVSVLNKITV